MAITYVLLNSVTVGAGGSSSMNFNSISGSYTDLLLKVSARNSVDGAAWGLQFNGVTGNLNYVTKLEFGDGSSANPSNPSQTNYILSAYTTNVTGNGFDTFDIYIPNYTTSSPKSVFCDKTNSSTANGATVYITLTSGNWTSANAPIVNLSIITSTGTIAQYSTAYLYGILNT